jgi:hypothetical protein
MIGILLLRVVFVFDIDVKGKYQTTRIELKECYAICADLFLVEKEISNQYDNNNKVVIIHDIILKISRIAVNVAII